MDHFFLNAASRMPTLFTLLLLTATNITYLLVSLFILYVGIILYVDGDYLYNKVKDFTLRRCELKFKA